MRAPAARQAAGEASSAPASVRRADRGSCSGTRPGVPADVDPAASVAGELCLLLPSHEHGPQASPHLLRTDDDGAGSGRPDRLRSVGRPHRHGSAPPTPSSSCSASRVTINPAWRSAIRRGSWPRWSKLALELLARGRVMPTLARSEDRWVARWEPVTTDPGDAERLRLLAGSMPPLLRAEVGSSEHGTPPETIVDGALGAFLDACARRFLAEPLLPRAARGRAPATRGGVDRRADRSRSGRRGGRTGARGARRATRRVARCDGALRGAPDVPDVLSPVRARGARVTGRRGARLAGRRGAVARRDPAAGEGRPERARPGARRCGARTAMACAFSAV